MLSTIIIVVSSLLGFNFMRKAKKPMTKYITLILGLASLLTLPYFHFLQPFSAYFYVLVSFVAAIEPQSSLHLKQSHKTFFAIVGFVLVLVLVTDLLQMGAAIPKYPLGLLYVGSFAALWFFSFRKIKTRLGILMIWLGQFALWAVQIF